MEEAFCYIKKAPTLKNLILRCFNLYKDRLFTVGVSYEDVAKIAAAWAKQLSHYTSCRIESILSPTIAVVGPNVKEWIFAEFAALLSGWTVVGLHSEWPVSEIEHVLRDSNTCIVLCICSALGHPAFGLIERAACNCGIQVLCLGDLGYLSDTPGASYSSSVSDEYTIPALIEYLHPMVSGASVTDPQCSRAEEAEQHETDNNSLHSIMYTSGTSGLPKGVPVSRGLWRTNALSCPNRVPKPIIISYNSMAHGSDRGRIMQSVCQGGFVVFSTEANLIADMIKYRPHYLFAFGNWWNELYHMCQDPANGAALRLQLEAIAPVVQLVVTGGTHTLPQALSFLTDMFTSADVIDSYGSTEAPGISSNGVINRDSYDFQLVDVPEQEYVASAGYGEIWVRPKNPSGQHGYWNNQEATAKAYTHDGWFRTGDIGHVDRANGKLAIVDRKNNLVELYANGRSVWVTAAKLEDAVYSRCPLVQRVFVCGDRMRDSVVAVVIPSYAAVDALGGDVVAIRDRISSSFTQLAADAQLPSWEIPTVIVVESADAIWSSSNGLLSTSGKLKRSALFAKYQAAIEQATDSTVPLPGKSDDQQADSQSGTAARVSESLHTAQETIVAIDRASGAETNLRQWQSCNIAGVRDYLDFSFSSLVCPEEAAAMNLVKQKMDRIVPLIRARVDELEELNKAPISRAKQEATRLQLEWNHTVTAAVDGFLNACRRVEMGVRNGVEEGGAEGHAQVMCAFQSLVRALSLRLVNIRRSFILVAEASAVFAESVAGDPLSREYDILYAELRQLSLQYRISIPAHIGFQFWLRNPKEPQKGESEDIGALDMGGEQCKVWDSLSGELIESGSKTEEKRERCVSLDEDNLVYSTEGLEMFNRIRDALSSLEASLSSENGLRSTVELIRGLLPRIDRMQGHLCACERISMYNVIDDIKPTNIESPANMINEAIKSFRNRPALGQPREWSDPLQVTSLCNGGYRWATFGDIDLPVHRLAKQLSRIAVPGTHVGICGFNSIEWAICDFACALAGMVSVGVHVTMDAPTAAKAIAHADLEILLVSEAFLVCSESTSPADGNRKVVAWRLCDIIDQLGAVKAVVTMDTPRHSSGQLLDSSSLLHVQHRLSLADIIHDSSLDELHLLAPSSLPLGGPSSLFTIIYTSGSSGSPKAVMHSAASFHKDVSARSFAVPLVTPSYIPLSHSSDRYKMWMFLGNGGRVGFAYYSPRHWQEHETSKKDGAISSVLPEPSEDNSSCPVASDAFNGVEGLFQQVQRLAPSGMACPPNIWNGLYALSASGKYSKEEIRSWFGPNMKFVITGGAPTSPPVLSWARDMMRPHAVVDSYGNTEIGALLVDGAPSKQPVAVEVKLEDVPSRNFHFPYGEILVRVPSMYRFSGYYKNKEASEVSFDGDGWFRTGDLGLYDATSGVYKVLDRVCAVYQYSSPGEDERAGGGHIVSPAAIEEVIETNVPGVTNCYVHVSFTESTELRKEIHISTVLVTSPEAKHLSTGEWRELVGKCCGNRLKPYEVPSRYIVSADPFTVENGLLTPSFKKCRNRIGDLYAQSLQHI
jgi:long-subunit acyl-CoA synthetase (AMP-forming)